MLFLQYSTWFGPTQFHHQMKENQTSLDEENLCGSQRPMFSDNRPFGAMLNCEPLKDRTTCFCASLKCQHPQIYQKLSYGFNLRENNTVSDIKVPKLPKRLLCEVSRFIDLFLLIVARHSDLESKVLHQFSRIGTVQKRL